MDLFRRYEPGWCRTRSSLERILIALLCFLVIVIVTLAILLGVLTSDQHLQHLSHSNKVTDVCLTEACVNAASSALKAMDKSIDPCEDFYSYACGGWINDRPLLPFESYHSVFREILIKNSIYLQKALEFSDDDNLTLSNAERKAKMFYASCIDTNQTLELGPKPLLNLINEVGGWVLLSNSTAATHWNWRSWNFQDTLIKIHKSSEARPLFQTEVSKTIVDTGHPKRNVLWAVPSGFTLSNLEHYKNVPSSSGVNNRLAVVARHMTDVVLLLGAQNNEMTFNSMMKVLEFEQKLVNIIHSSKSRGFDNLSVAEVQLASPFINWRQYLQELLEETFIQVKSAQDTINLFNTEYFSRVSTLLQPMVKSTDGLKVLHNYLLWHLAKSYLPHLSKPFTDAFQKVRQLVDQSDSMLSLDAYRCVQETDKRFPFATGALFVRGKFSEESKISVGSMTSYILEAFKKNIPSLPWIDSRTSKAVVEKVSACEEIIGYPEFIKNLSYMNNIYQKIPINEHKYFENVVAIVKFRLRENFLLLGTDAPSDLLTTGRYSLTQVNAGYLTRDNKFIIPAGFIQAPFLDNNYPKSLSFGSMGMFLGHELTHGYDNIGRNFDKNGILSLWWSPTSVRNFEKLTQCFVDQYSSYSVYGRNVDGNKTLGENISDNGGLKTSFYAYLNWVRDHQAEPMLPSINLTHEQLFFVAFAQTWCDNPSKSFVESNSLTDVHSLHRIRVIGSVSNSKEFSQHFQCKPGQPMNPLKKCEIW